MISYKNYKSLSFSNDKIYDKYFHLTEDEFNIVIDTAEKYKMKYIDYDNCFKITSYDVKESDEIRKALIELRQKVPNLSIVGIADYNKKEYENIVHVKRQLETLSNEQYAQIKIFEKRYPELWNKLMNL